MFRVRPSRWTTAFLSSYRSELGGILASLSIIHRICAYAHITAGSAMLYCDNKSAPAKTFQHPNKSITPFLTTDNDILHLAQ